MTTPLPVIENGFRVAHNYKSADATFTNVYWILAESPVDVGLVGADFIAAYAHVKSSFSMKSLHSTDITFVSVDVTALDGVSPTVETLYSSGVHGSGGSPMAAANASLVITWVSDERGRSNRGRSYLAGMPNGSLEAGGARWGTALIADAQDAVASFFEGLTSSGVSSNYDLLVVSQHAASGPHHRLVGEGLPRVKVGSQRRRTQR